MDKVLKEMEILRRDIEKIKVFCAFVAEEHDHIPHLKRIWNEDAGNFLYHPDISRHDELNIMKGTIMKALLELEDRIASIEQLAG